jgi:hypothetical protein
VRVPAANVTSSDTRWVKARVELGDDVTVHDIITGTVLAVLPGPATPAGDRRWKAGDVDIVAVEPGCLCAGTVVETGAAPRRWVRRSPSRVTGTPPRR